MGAAPEGMRNGKLNSVWLVFYTKRGASIQGHGTRKTRADAVWKTDWKTARRAPTLRFLAMLALLLLAAAAATAAGGGGEAADELAESCTGAQAQAPPTYKQNRRPGFCETAVWIAPAGLDGRALEDPGFWSAYASDRAARFVEGGGFHRHRIDMDTLEIAPSVSDPAASFPPGVNVTIRFDHGPPTGRGPCPELVWPASCGGAGRFEQTYAMNADYTFDFWTQPYLVDGRSALGSTVSCIEGFYLDIDAGICRPHPRCPPGSALYDGVCITWKACRGQRDAYVIDGRRWECPPDSVRDLLIDGSVRHSHRPPVIAGQTPAEWVSSCAAAAARPPPAGDLASDPAYAFCGAVAALGITPQDASRIASEVDWAAYAEQDARHFIDGWGFYQRYGEKGTLEVAPAVDMGAGQAVPEMAATVRFDYRDHRNTHYLSRGLDAGTFEHTFGVSMPPGDRTLPAMIDGVEAPGADIECPDDYSNSFDPTGCWYGDYCPDAAMRDGICEHVRYCDYLYTDNWMFCPATAEEHDELIRQYTGVWDPIILTVLAGLFFLAAIVSLPVLSWRWWRKRRRARRAPPGGAT